MVFGRSVGEGALYSKEAYIPCPPFPPYKPLTLKRKLYLNPLNFNPYFLYGHIRLPTDLAKRNRPQYRCTLSGA